MSKTRTVRGVGWDVAALGNGNAYFHACNGSHECAMCIIIWKFYINISIQDLCCE